MFCQNGKMYSPRWVSTLQHSLYSSQVFWWNQHQLSSQNSSWKRLWNWPKNQAYSKPVYLGQPNILFIHKMWRCLFTVFQECLSMGVSLGSIRRKSEHKLILYLVWDKVLLPEAMETILVEPPTSRNPDSNLHFPIGEPRLQMSAPLHLTVIWLFGTRIWVFWVTKQALLPPLAYFPPQSLSSK